MTKQLNLGSLTVNIPDYNTDVGKLMESLQNDYESGSIRALFVVYAKNSSIAHASVGDAMILPFVTMSANAISSASLDQIENAFFGEEDDE